MAWTIEFSSEADKLLTRLDKPVAKRLYSFMVDRIALLEDPRSIGEALKGSKLGEFWKYRVGDYRLICEIQDGALKVLVVKLGNRREVYR